MRVCGGRGRGKEGERERACACVYVETSKRIIDGVCETERLCGVCEAKIDR